MKKILLFVVGMLCFVGGVNADILPYSELYFSKLMVGVCDQVYLNYNDFMNETGIYTIKYDENHLKYDEFHCYVNDNNEGMTPCTTICKVDNKNEG